MIFLCTLKLFLFVSKMSSYYIFLYISSLSNDPKNLILRAFFLARRELHFILTSLSDFRKVSQMVFPRLSGLQDLRLNALLDLGWMLSYIAKPNWNSKFSSIEGRMHFHEEAPPVCEAGLQKLLFLITLTWYLIWHKYLSVPPITLV